MVLQIFRAAKPAAPEAKASAAAPLVAIQGLVGSPGRRAMPPR